MKNKSLIFGFLIFGILIFVISIVIFLCVPHDIFKSRKSYSEAEEYSVNYLNSNVEQLTKIAKEVIKEKSDDGFPTEISEIRSIYYGDSDVISNSDYVTFNFYDNGFYHDVDWGLIYSPSNKFEGENKLYTYDQSINDTKGNNVYVRKKIKDNWFFYYSDYDGDTNLSEIAK